MSEDWLIVIMVAMGIGFMVLCVIIDSRSTVDPEEYIKSKSKPKGKRKVKT